MNKQQEHLNNLSEIRSIMERSCRFISLSGLSGVFAGIFALVGALIAFWYFDYEIYIPNYYDHIFTEQGNIKIVFLEFLFINASCVLLLSIGFSIFFTTRKAKQKGLPVWDSTAKRLVINLLIPLVTGGIFCLILLFHKEVYLLAPATLIFYGLALLNASKYTLKDIRYLGLSEIILGLAASVFVGYGLVFWVVGFGLLHIIYGALVYYKYDR